MTELKPCPFCGSENISMWITDRGEPFGALYYFECQNCGVKTEPDDDEIDATFAWNRRSEVRGVGKWISHGDCGVVECSACKWSIEEYVEYNYCPSCGAKMEVSEDA